MSMGVIVFSALTAHSFKNVEGVCALAGAQTPSTFLRNRLACEPGKVKKQHVRRAGKSINLLALGHINMIDYLHTHRVRVKQEEE
jgi:hypothetical protein